MTYLGVDLAWNIKARTGLATVNGGGQFVTSSAVRTDAEIDAWVTEHCPDMEVAAVDAPLIVTNPTGLRPCERLITSVYGRFDAGCHASNMSKPYMNPPRAHSLAQRHGWTVDPETPGQGVCIEVYPHPATIGLFGLGRILPYKGKGGRPLAIRRTAALELIHHLESVEVLELANNARWQHVAASVRAATRPMHLEQVEDEIDAVLCAHLAWLWRHRQGALQVYGDTATGYIVAPPPPAHPPSPRVAKPDARAPEVKDRVELRISGSPATFATASEAAWRTAVHDEAERTMTGCTPLPGRISVSIEFVTAVRPGGHPGWDLDNLIKPTIDALTPVLGLRPGNWRRPQADDERIDEIHARKRSAAVGEQPGATIVVTSTPPQLPAEPSPPSGPSPA